MSARNELTTRLVVASMTLSLRRKCAKSFETKDEQENLDERRAPADRYRPRNRSVHSYATVQTRKKPCLLQVRCLQCATVTVSRSSFFPCAGTRTSIDRRGIAATKDFYAPSESVEGLGKEGRRAHSCWKSRKTKGPGAAGRAGPCIQISRSRHKSRVGGWAKAIQRSVSSPQVLSCEVRRVSQEVEERERSRTSRLESSTQFARSLSE